MYSWLSLTHTGYHMTYHCCHRPVVRGKQFQPLRKDSTAYKNTTFDCQFFFTSLSHIKIVSSTPFNFFSYSINKRINFIRNMCKQCTSSTFSTLILSIILLYLQDCKNNLVILINSTYRIEPLSLAIFTRVPNTLGNAIFFHTSLIWCTLLGST